MTALRQEAFQLLENVPEEDLFALIQFMQAEKIKRLTKEQRIEEKRIALEELKKLSKSVQNFDYEKELANYREEKFNNAYLG